MMEIKVKHGNVLVSIEAMKMETSVFAERDGVVEKILHNAGTQVDNNDLLIMIESK